MIRQARACILFANDFYRKELQMLPASILVVGGSGREHALIRRSASICASNGGIAHRRSNGEIAVASQRKMRFRRRATPA